MKQVELKKKCINQGLRLTRQRVAVLEVVRNSSSHPDVESVYEEVRKEIEDISIDTVYRSLQLLEELGFIFKVDSQIPRARFDGDLRPHCHFICMKCGEVFDIFMDEGIKLPLNSLKFGEIKHINLQVKGICNRCKE